MILENMKKYTLEISIIWYNVEMKYSTIILDESEYIQVTRNYYSKRIEWAQLNESQKHIELCRCISARRKNFVLTGQSACAILGIPRLDVFEMRPHAITQKKKGTDVVCWRRGKPDIKSKEIDGFQVASPTRIICDLAKYDSLESLLVSINHCLRSNLFTKNQLLAEISNREGMRWKNSLLKVLKYATKKCESPLETKAWIAIHRAGFVLPEQQKNITSQQNKKEFLGRVDMFWEIKKRKIILELDGAIKYLNKEVLFDEKKREDKLRESGYEIIRATWKDIETNTLIKKLEKISIPKRRYKKRMILKVA